MPQLNQSQKKRVLVALARLDRSLAEIEARIVQGGIKSLLWELQYDLSALQVEALHDGIAEARAEIQHAIELLHVPINIRRSALSWHVETLLTAESVSISELSPENLRAYGPLDPAAAELIQGAQDRLIRAIDGLQEFVRQGRERRQGRDVG